MYEELIKRLRERAKRENEYYEHGGDVINEAADAIEELQATLCNWCAVCPRDKRDLSTCEIYESCRANPPKEE